MTDPKIIKDWLEEHQVQYYTILPNGEVNTEFSVDLSVNSLGRKLTEIPVKFNEVGGTFDCGEQDLLKTLKFAPRKVEYDFWCIGMGLTSLEHCPEKVLGNFLCPGNDIQNLEFFPQFVGKDFVCGNNPALGALQDTVDFKIAYAAHTEYLRAKAEKELLLVSVNSSTPTTIKSKTNKKI